MKTKKNSKLKWIVVGSSLLILLIGAFYYWNKGRSSESEVKYTSLLVERGDLIINISSTGGVEPENRLQIKPPVAGIS